MIKLLPILSVLFICLLSVDPAQAAISFFRSTPERLIESISADDFSRCEKKIFRVKEKSQLQVKEKKLLLRALLLGETVENLDILKRILLERPYSCCYTAEEEKSHLLADLGTNTGSAR